jgi:hypothetical protein
MFPHTQMDLHWLARLFCKQENWLSRVQKKNQVSLQPRARIYIGPEEILGFKQFFRIAGLRSIQGGYKSLSRF